MEQVIEKSNDADLADLEAKRTWVLNHFDPDSRYKYQDLNEKLRLLEVIVREGWVGKDETLKLQCLGVTFGDALAQSLGMEWVTVIDEYGRDSALRKAGTTIVIFPLTMISKRVERGEIVNIAALFESTTKTVREMEGNLAYLLN
jgi:Domain of unknown function (DUF3806)